MRIGPFLLAAALALVAGCGSGIPEPQGGDLSKTEEQPAADLAKGAEATTMEQWSAANPDNGKPGSGEAGGK
jgi:hypothetical protein